MHVLRVGYNGHVIVSVYKLTQKKNLRNTLKRDFFLKKIFFLNKMNQSLRSIKNALRKEMRILLNQIPLEVIEQESM